MVQILPNVNNFGQEFAKQLGGGLSKGIEQRLDMYNQLNLEKERAKFQRELQLGQQRAKLPSGASSSQSGSSNLENEVQGTFRGKSLNPQELRDQAIKNTQERLNRGDITADFDQELARLKSQNQDIKAFDAERQQFGEQALAKLGEVYPKASQDVRSYLQSKMEGYYNQGFTPAEIDKKLGLEAKNLTNRIASIEKSIPPKRGFNKLKGGLLGTNRDSERARTSIRLKVQDLLDAGLDDTVRSGLQKAGYSSEETESVIHPLPFNILDDINSLKGNEGFFRHRDASDVRYSTPKKMIEPFRKSLKSVISQNPDANLLLLRKAYEDRGIGWREFKNALEDLTQEGVFQLTPEHLKFWDKLDEPPLSGLNRILFNIGSKGR